MQALGVNLLSSLATLVGGVLAYFALQPVQEIVPTLLSLAAASMLYVAVADLIPGLHKAHPVARHLAASVADWCRAWRPSIPWGYSFRPDPGVHYRL